MKASLAWLNRYLDRPCDAEEAQAALTRVGFPEDGRDDHRRPDGSLDPVIDFEVTSNRSDCLSHIGLARELAAATGRTLQRPSFELPRGTTPITDLTGVDNQDMDLCPLYTARVLVGVRVGPSPSWLAECLEAIGLRPVNNVVDVTNFVLHELGQPLHAFDLDRLDQRRIVVRRAHPAEPFTAIDGSKHELRPEMLVIADAQEAVAVAGVMGGLDSEVKPDTKDLLIESAHFEPLSVRRTSRALKLFSDSSFRFERGIDPLGVDAASRRACGLILELAGGTLAQGAIAAGRSAPAPIEVSMRTQRCNALLGVELSADEQAGHLRRLDLSPRVNGKKITCAIPTHRLDLKREVDLIEEVARLHDLDRVPVQEKIHIVTRAPQAQVRARQQLRRVLVGRGYHQTVTPSFITAKFGAPFVAGERGAVHLHDPSRHAGGSMLRPSLLPSLLVCRKANQDLGNDDVNLFELASTWTNGGGRIHEHNRLVLVRDVDEADAAIRELRGALQELFETLGGRQARKRLHFAPATAPWGSAVAGIALADEAVGHMGLVDRKLLDLFDLQAPVAAADLGADRLLGMYPPQRRLSDLPRYPGIERDLSVIVDQSVRWQQIAQCVEAVAPALLEELSFLGTYRGRPIPSGHKSVSLRLTFRDPDRTLRHEQVDPQVAAIVAALESSVGAQLR